MAEKSTTIVDTQPTVGISDSDNDSSLKKRAYFTGDAFVSGGAIELYEPIPEYEGKHRYDPTAEWTEKEEKKLVRKVSLFLLLRLLLFTCLLTDSSLGSSI